MRRNNWFSCFTWWMCDQTIELLESASAFLGSAARVDEFHCQDLSALQILSLSGGCYFFGISSWAALFPAAFRPREKLCAFVPELTQAQITCWPPGMWSNLVLAEPSANGSLHCQNYWSIQWLRGVQQAADRFEPSEWEGTFCFASPAILISALPGWGRGSGSSWRGMAVVPSEGKKTWGLSTLKP